MSKLFDGVKKQNIEYYNLVDFEERYSEVIHAALENAHDLSSNDIGLTIISLQYLCDLVEMVKEDIDPDPLFDSQYEQFKNDTEGIDDKIHVFINIEGYCL